MSGARSINLVGPHTDEMIRSYHVEKAVISCKGLSLEDGITDSDEQDVSSKRMMLQASKERILVADSSKFGKTAFTRVADWNYIDKIVTDKEPSSQWLEKFKRLGVECIYPTK